MALALFVLAAVIVLVFVGGVIAVAIPAYFEYKSEQAEREYEKKKKQLERDQKLVEEAEREYKR